MQNILKTLGSQILDRSARTAVVGLGYVGLPLAIEMARAGFETLGLDISTEKVKSLNRGINYIQDVDSNTLKILTSKGKFKAATDFSKLSSCDFISICVPTPLSKGKNPDMSYILNAVLEVKNCLRRGQVIILESTTYPGTTDEAALPLLEESGLKVGEDFWLAFSPERIDPGNKIYDLKNTPKIVGGITKNCTEIAQSFYQTFIDRVIPVSSTRVAEMVKILENTFRAINIGLANEMAIMCHHLGIDVWEVIDAAASKPFGFMPFYPGPGLGGHCIPIDPHYLLWKLKSMNYHARFIQLADEINTSMPGFVIEKITAALNNHHKALNGAKILVLGISYKQDTDDYRESPALDIINKLQQKGANVFYHDPYVPELRVNGYNLSSIPLVSEEITQFDCVALLTNHSCFDMGKIVDASRILVDTRNATKGTHPLPGKVVKI